MTSSLPEALLSHLWLLVGSVVLAELLARGGRGVLPWWRGVPAHPLSRWGLATLIGLAGWGLAFLGLALAGLFIPAVLGATVVGMALAAAGGWRGSRIVDAARGWAGVGRLPAAVLAVAAVLIGSPAFVRESNFDSFIYHLGVPGQYLLAHRAILGDIQLQFHLSLPVEMAFALPLALGDDRLARALTMVAFVAANAVFVGLMLARGRRTAAWAGPVLALSAPSIAWLVSLAKNDIAASAYVVAGALLTAGGCWGLGSVLLGCAVSAKFAYAPMVAVWCLAARPPHARLRRVALGLALPGLAWWIKTWLAVGTPLFPFTAGIIPSPFWGPYNQGVWGYYVRADWAADTMSAAGLPAAWVRHMGADYFLALLLLPGLVLLSRPRRLVVGVIVAMVGTLAVGHLSRFMVPMVWWVCLKAAVDFERLPGWTGRLAGPLLAGTVLVQLAVGPGAQLPAWSMLSRSPRAQWEIFSTLKDTVAELKGLAAPRVFVVGDLRSYRWPGRIVFDGACGETPTVWRFAHESRTVADLRRKFRQTGARWMLYNYVSVEWVAIRYHVFPWRDDALRLYVDFCRRYLRYHWRTEQSDYMNGGFCVFEILPRPLAKPPATIWFAPGTEGLYGGGILLHNSGRPQDALQHYLAAWRRLPDVGTSWNLVGHEYAVLNDSENAYKYLEKFARQGMMDSLNLGEFAAALVRTGRLEEGGRLLEEAARRYPGHRVVVLVNQAAWCGRMAVQALGARKAQEVLDYLDRGDGYLAQVPPQLEGSNEAARRSTQAYLIGLRGELYALLGRRAEAVQLLQRAIELAPESTLQGRWKSILEAVTPKLFQGP